ncbi:E3 ubiquitin-protein ligase COP1-like [Anneissia japonica]|uniref:E3 ubiquitin-protein ligase COP1-like n=1 Tax=Anneissia japonica TaxID=1529436 RepID=UPI0014256C64|nr:E3 ubiquitin-protein ligase COP1-like [Anneissia japonica]
MSNTTNRRPSGRPRTEINRKRPLPSPAPVYNGVGSSYEDKDNDFVCPICFEVIEEAHMTKCGHSFCYKCITKSLVESNRCPKCNFFIDKSDQIFPNFSLNELILKHRQRQEEKRPKLGHMNTHQDSNFMDLLSSHDKWELSEVNFVLEFLVNKKRRLEMDSQFAQNQILREFLDQAKRKKQEQVNELQKQLHVLEEDRNRIEETLSKQRISYSNIFPDKSVDENGTSPSTSTNVSICANTDGVSDTESPQDGFNGSKYSGRHQWLNSTIASRKKKLYNHFTDLESCYFAIRQSQFEPSESSSVDLLGKFKDCLTKFTKYSSIQPLATLSYATDIYNSSSIVSSIEFDRDNEFFAIAGVTRKIKVFEYATVIQDAVDIHYPVTEMLCSSKISCISWNAYHKGILASSDYEGNVTLWDAFTGSVSRLFQEHQKRCWSIDFNKMDPKLLASGSDDAKVKLWSTNMEQSVTCIEAKANVCCVKFNPSKVYDITFGSADHCVHYYDLRNPKKPLNIFKGHKKAVSYTKFLNSEEIVSASTDSQLKLWNVNKTNCLRTFTGHTNEKNFVGLTANDGYIACGSENNSLSVYYKGLSKQLLAFKFDTIRSVLDSDKREEDSNEFVSAVAWRTGSNVCVAANSQGTIKILELV